MHAISKPAFGLLFLSFVAFASYARADEPNSDRREETRRAITRGLAIVQKGARTYPSNRECFACHHQTLPLLGIVEARARAIEIDAELPAAILEFTQNSFRDRIEDLKKGEGIGGKGLTVGYGLWTMQLGGAKPDDLTDAMVTFLLKTQEKDGHWVLHSIRPPAEESLVTSTVVAAHGLKTFATGAQREAATVAVEKARTWLSTATLEHHEDRVARLWGFKLLGSDAAGMKAARNALLETQRADGGWAQEKSMEPDAYATASALYVLLDAFPPATGAGEKAGSRDAAPNSEKQTEEEADAWRGKLERAARWLLAHQLDDGSWHVKTRATPVQVYFDNGDPHGKDQFLSIAATGWSIAALAHGLKQEPAK
jgi:N-acyl-D-amino-acid deacylase